jgi:hypothetical protein
LLLKALQLLLRLLPLLLPLCDLLRLAVAVVEPFLNG